ncbi:uncharacterized protein BDV14DRAFT_201232 [Aspergillus stella-maris]|uniref:uncharacterized protein n=1 Tax=Aspergillus stella-maris TaxID=1810926 RepID=UPI003CCE0B9E
MVDLPNTPPSLYVDVEGVNLSRHGTVSILQVYHLPQDKVYGYTALQLAAGNGFLWMARRLIDLGADVNEPRAREFGPTALEGASRNGRLDMVHLLLISGASVTGPDGERQYKDAVRWADTNGHYTIVRLLEKFKLEQEDQIIEID